MTVKLEMSEKVFKVTTMMKFKMSERVFKITVIKMLKYLVGKVANVYEQMENFKKKK